MMVLEADLNGNQIILKSWIKCLLFASLAKFYNNYVTQHLSLQHTQSVHAMNVFRKVFILTFNFTSYAVYTRQINHLM
jgi:hypothetical protein